METCAGQFEKLLTDIQTRDSEFFETESIPLDRWSITESGVIFDKNSFPIDSDTRLRLLAKVGAPRAYLADRSIDLQILVSCPNGS